MKKIRMALVGGALALMWLRSICKQYFIEGVNAFRVTNAYEAGRFIGNISFLVIAVILFYLAFTKGTYRCKECKKKLKVDNNWGIKFGNPFFHCEECGHINYDSMILEPALLPKSSLENIKRKSRNENRMACVVLVLYLNFMAYLTFGGWWAVGLLVLNAVLFLVVILIENRKSNIMDFDNEIKKSLIRLQSDPEYLNEVVKRQGVGRDSAWNQQKRDTAETDSEVELCKEERAALYNDIWNVDIKKKVRMWLLVTVSGISVIVMGIICYIQNIQKFGMEDFISIKKVTSESENAYSEVEGMLGPAAYTENGDYYIAVAGENFSLIYVDKEDAEKYKIYNEWLYNEEILRPEKTTVYGYSVKINEQLSEVVEKALVATFGDNLIDNVVYELFGEYYLIVDDIDSMRGALEEKTRIMLVLGTIELAVGIAMILYAKRRNKL